FRIASQNQPLNQYIAAPLNAQTKTNLRAMRWNSKCMFVTSMIHLMGDFLAIFILKLKYSLNSQIAFAAKLKLTIK
ncbi:hypothetical protein R0K17_30830, partial [Planococcus sp. SIMBA_143]